MKKKLFLIILVILLLTSIKIAEPTEQTKDDIVVSKQSVILEQSQSILLENYLAKKGHQEFLTVAEAIRESCIEHDMPFETILAIAILESGYGTSKIASQKKNFFAIGAYDWNPINSASDFSNLPLQEAIDKQVMILKKDYFLKYDNLEDIAKKYCKNWMHWLEEVMCISKEIKEIFQEKAQYKQIK